MGEDGFALLTVLGFMLLFAMFLMPFAASSRVKALSTSYEYDRMRLEYAAEAINGYLAWRLGSDADWRRQAEQGEFLSLDCLIDHAAARISIVPHARLINLNTAEEPLLKSGLQNAGLPVHDAETIARLVMQFRSPRIPDGDDATGVAAGFKHASFEDLSELHDFDRLRDISVAELGRIFSVHSGQSILSKSLESLSPSLNYTIETVLFDRDSWAGDGAIFLAGNGVRRSKRIASIDIDAKPERPLRARGCEAVLGQDVVQLIGEVLT